MEEKHNIDKAGVCPSCAPLSPQSEATHILLRVIRRHHCYVERQISDLGIHHSQRRMLTQLARYDKPPSQRELAERMGISPAAVATMLKKLEKEGYISRTPTDGDSRRNEIRITETGHTKVAESREVFDSAYRALFNGMTEEDLHTLSALVHRMDENLDILGVPDPCCRKSGD